MLKSIAKRNIKGKEMLNLKEKLIKKFEEREQLNQHYWLDSGYKLSDLFFVLYINQYLAKEENELKYGFRFIHEEVEKDENGRFYIIRQKEKLYVNNYPDKKITTYS